MKAVFLIFLVLLNLLLSAEFPSVPTKSFNVNGDIRFIGNTVLCWNNGNKCGDYTTIDNTTNADLDLMYVKTDATTPGITNSSQAELAMASGFTVLWAGLYWQGYIPNGKSGLDPRKIKLRRDGTAYRDFTASSYETIANGSNGYTYSSFVEITDYINSLGTNASGYYTAANIAAYTGTDSSGLGNFGAWALVVIYSNKSEKLRNISVYNGYKRVDSSNQVTINVGGFLTPTSGNVNSIVSVFSAEGDYNIRNDRMTVDGIDVTTNDSTNIFNSSTTGFNKNPSFINNQGIDIDNFPIGKDGNSAHPQIIGNNKTSAVIRLYSTQDAYFPSVVAFSSELYKPDVCYQEQALDSNGSNVLGGAAVVKKGSALNFQVDITNKNNEPANGVYIEKFFDDNYTQYIGDSLQVKNIGESAFSPKSDALNDDTAAHDATNKKIVFYLGSNSASGAGGRINQNQVASFKYSSKLINIPESKTISNTYKVSYRNDQLGVTFSGLPINKCTDFNSSFSVKQAEGFFRVVEAGKSWDSKILTKIVNKTEAFDILASESGSTFIPAEQLLKSLRMVDGEGKSIKDNLETNLSIGTTGKVVGKNYVYDRAIREAYFQCQDENDVWNICSDAFAVRPDRFDIITTLVNTAKTGTPTHKAGQDFSITVRALDGVNNPIQDFNESFILASDKKYPEMKEKGVFSPLSGKFANGTATLTVNYDEVGVIELNVSKNDTFAGVDSGDVGIGTKYIIPEYTMAVGRFIPEKFVITPSISPLKNFNNGTFTYFANLPNGSNMGAFMDDINFTIRAVNVGGALTRNYDRGAGFDKTLDTFSTDINISQMLGNNAVIEIDGGLPNPTCLNGAKSPVFGSGEANVTFDNECAKTVFRFNYPRNSSQKVEPKEVSVANGDFNLSLRAVDADNVSGDAFASASGGNATFLYGRINPIDADNKDSGYGNTINAPIYVEVYSNTQSGRDLICRALYGTSTCGIPSPLTPSVNDIGWWQNIKHNESGINIPDVNITGSFVTVASPTSSLAGSMINKTYNFIGTPPSRVKMRINLNGLDFLYYNKFPPLDQNVSHFYLNFMTQPTTPSGTDVVTNEGVDTRGTSRIGE